MKLLLVTSSDHLALLRFPPRHPIRVDEVVEMDERFLDGHGGSELRCGSGERDLGLAPGPFLSDHMMMAVAGVLWTCSTLL